MWCEFSGELGAVCGVSSLESWGQCVVYHSSVNHAVLNDGMSLSTENSHLSVPIPPIHLIDAVHNRFCPVCTDT